MKFAPILPAVALVSGLAVGAAQATTIDGSLKIGANSNNVYNPSAVNVPGTFDFSDDSNHDTAAFTSTSLVITDSFVHATKRWTQSFTASTSGFFDGLALVSDSFLNGISYNLAGDTLTVTWHGADYSATYAAEFSFSSAPEPATWAMMALGFAGLGFASFRASRRRAVAA